MKPSSSTFLAARESRTLLATSIRDASGSGVHVFLRSYRADGSTGWTRNLRREAKEQACVATGLSASDAATVVMGYPPDGATTDRSFVWVLRSRSLQFA